MIDEKELLTILSRKEYSQVEKFLKAELGKPKIQKRLSLQSDNYAQVNIDTRIRITNGKVELIQKVGDWKNITKGKPRKEISVPLLSDAKIIFALYEIIRNLIRGPKVENIVMQYKSCLWKNKSFEIKLTYQFGKSDAYNCEVEVFDHSLNPEDLAREYKIPIHLPTQTPNFWRKWNKKINLFSDELSDKELLKIIKGYL
ncbi:hypothetical protein ACFLZP_01945 [Patescibacteria group bacterium]